MEYISNTPMIKVDAVVEELQSLASMCGIMMNVGDSRSSIRPDEVARVMTFFWDRLQTQINELESIQWPKGMAVTA